MVGSTKLNPARPRKRVEAETASLKRARDGSAFTRREECNKDVPIVLIDMHGCSFDSKIRMNLEAQVVEKETQIKKPERKRAAPSSVNNERKSEKAKSNGDPNKPRRPPTAFFVFMDEFRKTYKETHPTSKGVTSIAKDRGEKWRSMSGEEKKVYTDRPAELKADLRRQWRSTMLRKLRRTMKKMTKKRRLFRKGRKWRKLQLRMKKMNE